MTDGVGLTAPGDPWAARAVPLALLLLALLFGQGLVFIGESSQTSDEATHLASGYSYLKTANFRLNPEHPPLIKELAALPLLFTDAGYPWGAFNDLVDQWNIGRIFVHENRISNDAILLLGRLPILGLSIALGWAMFCWGRRLFGPRAALLGLALYVLDPNVVAHSCLVTTDLGVTVFMFLAVYALWAWSERPAPWPLLLAGLAIGGAFASKFTALWLLPILGLLGAVILAAGSPIPARPWSASGAPAAGRRFGARRVAALLLAGAVAAAVAFVVVTACYAFRGLPAYAIGLERGLHHSQIGHMAYLNGHYSDTGWWYYFLYAYLIKTPIGTLLVIAVALLALARGTRRPFKDEMFLWIPVLVTIGITCVWRVNIGLRHLLPIYPFLYVAAGRALSPARAGADAARRGAWPERARPIAVLVCLVWNVFEAFSIAPYHLAYFNQLVGGPKNGHLYLLDSNLDWGQSAKALRRYMASRNVPSIYCAFSGNSDPWYYGVHYQYVPGTGNLDNAKRRAAWVPDDQPVELLAVSAMVLHSVHFTDQGMYAWLRERRPIAMPGYAFLVYDITGDAETHSYIAVLCLNFGLLDLADREVRRTLRIDPHNALAQEVLKKIREAAEQKAGGSM